MVTQRKLGSYGVQIPLDEQEVQSKLMNLEFTAAHQLPEGDEKKLRWQNLIGSILGEHYLPSNKYCAAQLRINRASRAAALARDLSPEQVAQVITTSILGDWKNV